MRYLLLVPIIIYRYCISPLLPPSCRFLPTCSEYTFDAIKRHGAWYGFWLSLRRLSKCHPFKRLGACHGYDPVPVEILIGAWYAPWRVQAKKLDNES
jgi:uncharacterized protein